MSEARPIIWQGVLGAALGGIVGYYGFRWLVAQGLYGLIIPPGLLGVAAGYAVRGRSQPFALVCGAAGLGLALFSEWSCFPFEADDRWAYFLWHAHQLKPVTLLMLAVGTVICYRMALGPDAPAGS